MKENSFSGVLVLDKPEGLTSTSALEKVKKLLKVKKAGHGGTLDPIATGVLPILIGEATKMAQIFLEGDKIYEGKLLLGITTSTYDITGEVIKKLDVPEFTLETLQELAKSLEGTLEQVPPPFSAVKFKGRPLYKYARNGLFISKEPKKVKIYEFKIKSLEKDKVSFYLHCSKGTYVRSLIHELGERLECGAVLLNLRRLKKSSFHIEQALTLEELEQRVKDNSWTQFLIPIPKALEFLPKVIISEEFSKKVREGKPLYTSSFLSLMKFQKLTLSSTERWIRLLSTKGDLVAIIENPLLTSPSKPFIAYFKVFKN
ncbi:MAG: tRNA pseudouridine(55) synthase TruB [Thermodesulfobacteriaceae bacterium]|nr:tRNA pseudouridine(55) synthase TruB [Thermodesulfobacteriaceae bacterium]